MKQFSSNKYFPLALLFLVVNILIWIFKDFMAGFEIGANFILGANIILFLITFIGFYIQTKGVSSANINAFLRGIYSSLLLKMFIVMGAIFIYVLAAGGKVNQSSLLISMALYILYTAVEVVQLMKIVRKKPDA